MVKYKPAKELSPEALQIRRAKNAQYKRVQRLREANETLEDTHRRRRYALQQRQEKAFVNLNKKFEQRKTEIAANQERRMKDLRKAGELTDTTDAKNTKRHFDQKLNLQTKYVKDYNLKREKHKVQTQKLLSYQRSKLPPSQEPFTIERIGFRFSKKFTNYFDSYKVVVNHPPVRPIDVFVQILLETIRERNLVQGDYIRLTVDHHNWYKLFSFKRVKLTGARQDFAKIIHEFLEFVEYKSAALNELIFEVHSFKVPRGNGRLQATKSNLKKKLSVITIKNKDNLCAPRAIVTAVANLNKNKWSKSQLQDGFNKSRTLQTTEAKRLCDETQVVINEFGSTLEDIDTFAEHLNIQINIIDGDRLNELIYTTTNDFENGMIYLYKSGNHFDVITSMTGFFNKYYYCHDCKKSYTQRDKHRCPSKCTACFKNGKCNRLDQIQIQCGECNRTFFGQDCFDEHKRNRATKKGKLDIVCFVVQKCLQCKRSTTDLSAHLCGYSKCSNCDELVDPSTHQCYMKWKPSKGGVCTEPECTDETPKNKRCYNCKTRSTKYVFYDFETSQDTGIHVVNWVHAWTFDGEEFTFPTIERFCDFVFNDDTYKDYTFIAHNSKAFDNQFILKYCIEQGLKPYTIMNGSKIMYMNVNKRTFLDSLNHVVGRLADFPKTFGLTELKKGYFPHYFNTPENQNYVGPIPDAKYYGFNSMGVEDRAAFLDWHQLNVDSNYLFDFQSELRSYCRSDVDILRRSMIQFRELFLKVVNIDPLQYVTIASVCMAIMRSKYLKTKEVAVVKDTTNHETASKISIKWLNYKAVTGEIFIQHALNGGEYNISEVGKVDGYSASTNTVYEFQGCFWHGCPKCYSGDTINTKNKIDMAELNKRTIAKNKKIEDHGYNLVSVYECDLFKDFTKWFKSNPTEFVGPLNPRDAFFGGRTNGTKLKYDFKEGERGRYVDFNSLYPTVMFEERYPVGHPTKITDPKLLEIYNKEWFGFIKCKIEAPKGLYHPVLPVRTKCKNAEKLMFPLCRTCSEIQQQTTCEHCPKERSFIGTWCTNEVLEAVRKGYVVHKIYEVWNFDETTTEMWKGYIKKFLKIKMESTKMFFGPDCKYKSESEFKQIVQGKLGIELGEIKFNPGMRAIAKLCLNSLWG